MDDPTKDNDLTINDPQEDADKNASGSPSVDTATQVDFLVKSLIAEQADIREKLKEQRAMLKDALESDASYRDIEEQVKTLAKRKKEIQQTLTDSTSVKQVKEETQSLRNDLKTVDKKLAGYLQQYLETYNSRTIEDSDGQLREIITQYKLVKKVV